MRKTLSSQALRVLFLERPKRLFLFFSLASLIALLSSLFFPLWSLLLGPFIYGIPHLYSSLRYVHYGLNTQAPSTSTHHLRQKPLGFAFFTLVFSMITILRLWMHSHGLSTERLPLGELLPEWISYIVTFFGCLFLYRRSLKQTLQGLLLSSLILTLAWRFPLEIAGLIMLAHHFVGFIFWIHLSRQKTQDLNVAILCSLIFFVLHLLIFLGVFDPLYSLYPPSGEIPWASLDYSQIGILILPHATEYTTWFHATTAYSFGQTLHYFIWLKAIPDQHHHHSTPTTFRQSFKLLLEDFHPPFLIMGAFAAGSLLLIWILWNYPLARTLYFILASYHGFMELAALSLLPRRALS